MKLFNLMLCLFLLTGAATVAQTKKKSKASKTPKVQKHSTVKPDPANTDMIKSEPPKTDMTKPEPPKTDMVGPALPKVEQILEKNAEATGVRAYGSKITSTLTKGLFEMPAMGMKGTVEVYSKAPNKSLTVINLPNFGVLTEGFDGQIGWAQDPVSGLREKKGDELALAKRSSDFSRKQSSHYSKFELKGVEKLGEAEAYVILVTPKEGKPETWYIDTKTWLDIRQDTTFSGPQGEFAAKVFFEDYRDVEGIKTPFLVRMITSAFEAVMKFEQTKTNVEIDDAKFIMPKP